MSWRACFNSDDSKQKPIRKIRNIRKNTFLGDEKLNIANIADNADVNRIQTPPPTDPPVEPKNNRAKTQKETSFSDKQKSPWETQQQALWDRTVKRLGTIVAALDDPATNYETALGLIAEAEPLFDSLPEWEQKKIWPADDMPVLNEPKKQIGDFMEKWSPSEKQRRTLVDAGISVLLNMRKNADPHLKAWAEKQGLLVRIDRRSKWGNPFAIGKDGNRDQVIKKYETYIKGKPDMPAAGPGLKGKALGCWCYPEKCHGDVLLKLAYKKRSFAILSDPSFGGPSWEYSPYGPSLNLYKGCTHGCKYCYGPGTLRKGDAYFSDPDVKDDVLKKLERDLSKIDKSERVFLSFVGDVYQPAAAESQTTRHCLEMIRTAGKPFTVLTKGGTRATRDFDLYRPGDVFGTSICFSKQSSADKWEPNAASLKNRIAAIEQAKQKNIATWVSLEPVIDPDEALQVIRQLAPLVDYWSVGKLNHMDAIAKTIDWCRFYQDAIKLLDSLGAKYRIKRALLVAKDETGEGRCNG